MHTSSGTASSSPIMPQAQPNTISARISTSGDSFMRRPSTIGVTTWPSTRVAEFHEAHQQHQRHADQRAHVGREIQQRRHRAPQQCVLQADAEQHQDAGKHQPDQGIDHADGCRW
ncbi:hypothetical protein G6F62_014728 [Rhizopus arrhizus]|nr:hypothetical protein G6F62_014728 [Rhizopus arrhizus]